MNAKGGKIMTRTTTALAAICTGMLGLAVAAPEVQAYPDRPIRIIVPYSPGGSSDVVTRILAQHLEQALDQSVVVMNVAGGGGAVGWQQLKDTRADGYTLGIFVDAIPVMEATGAIDFTSEDFDQIAMWGTMDITVFAAADGSFETLEDLRAAAAADPENTGLAIGYGTPSQFVGQIVADALGVELNLVNVGGGAEKKAAVMGGHVAAGIEPMPGMAEPYRGGQLHILAVLGDERPAAFPDVQTAREQGFDAIAFNSYALMAPKGTPEDRLDILADAVASLADDPDFLEANRKVSFNVDVMDREATNAHVDATRERMLQIGERLGF
jgi:tripartite-type tricarboxylate transporter receptor subunit TctC